MTIDDRTPSHCEGPDTPGEREWRDWLESRGAIGPREWAASLAAEAGERIDRGETACAVRLLETAVSPASPVFARLTGPPAKRLARDLETRWNAATESEREPSREWARRFEDVLAVLNQWIRYRRSLEHEMKGRSGLRADPLPAREEDTGGRETSDAYYRDWVLEPFKENLLAILGARGLSRKQFCRHIDISDAYLSQILNGRRTPSLKKLADISWALRTMFWRLFLTKHGTPAGGDAEGPPEPGDSATWRAGQVSRPRDALERHFKLVFYPGPALPEERLPARSQLIVNPAPGVLKEGTRYVVRDPEGTVGVASYVGLAHDEPGRRRFVEPSGRTLWEGTVEDGVEILGELRGVLVEA